MKKNGFTLIELLVVVAVIGILIGVLFHGVFGVTKVSNKKRNANNAQLVEAAIMEYRHDMGKWPIPDEDATGATAKTQETGSGSGSSNARKRKNIVWTLVYGEVDGSTGSVKGKNNDVVVEYLLNGKLGAKKADKKYLDLHTFTTTEDGTASKYMVEGTEETVSAYEWWRDHGGNGKGLALVYRAKFVQCPVCKKYVEQPNGQCDSRTCHDTEQNPDAGDSAPSHIFSERELSHAVEGALPYKITFDFVNSAVKVETN